MNAYEKQRRDAEWERLWAINHPNEDRETRLREGSVSEKSDED